MDNYIIAKHRFIGDKLMQQIKIKCYNKNLYIYDNGVYTHDDSKIEREILNINENATKSLRNEIFEYIRIKKSNEILNPINNYINFKNGLYDIENKKFIPHTPEIFAINQINANYLEKNCINADVEKFLNDITESDPIKKQTILQIIGYSMTTNVEFQKAFVFYGPSAENGKSTLIQILSNLVGKKNISHVTIHDLQRGRFYAAEIENKLLNTVTELPRNNLNSVELFKSIVTGDSISVENKYENRHKITPYAKHIFTTNELPSVGDTSNGYYRRLNILPFSAHFTDKQKKNFDLNKLLTQNSIDYLAFISINAYLEMLETRHFANEEESNKIIMSYKKDNDSVSKYLYDSVHFMRTRNENNLIPKKSLYADYLNFCSDFNYAPVGRTTFYNKAKGSNLFSMPTIRGTRYFRCLKQHP